MTSADEARTAVKVDVGERFTFNDVLGGLAAMLVAFPSSIAYGVVVFASVSPSLAGLGALSGMVGAVVLGIVAPLIGRNGGFVTSPCAPAAAVLAGLATRLVAKGTFDGTHIVLLIFLTASTSAFLQILYGVLGAGSLIKFIPYQVATGYLSGVAVIIFIAQVPQLLGVRNGTSVGTALVSPRQWHWVGIVVGAVTITMMVVAPRLTRRIPATIIALAAGASSYALIAAFRPELRHATNNPLVLGPLQTTGSVVEDFIHRLSAVPSLGLADLLVVVAPAATLSILLSFDTLKTGVSVDLIRRTRHNSNRELIAQGVANAASSLAGGMSGAAGSGPTLVNITGGGRTHWSGVVEGTLALIAFVALGRAIQWMPVASLAAILLVIAWKMFDFEFLRLLFLPSARLDFVIIAAVIIVAAGVGLIEATVVGLVLAVALFIRNQIHSSVIGRKSDLSLVRSNRLRSAEESDLLREFGSEALFVQLKDDLFFGTSDKLFVDLERDLSFRRFILFDFRRVQSMDYTAVHLFQQMQQRLSERPGQLLFCGMPSTRSMRQDIERYISQLGLVGATRIRLFESRNDAVEWMEEQILERLGWRPRETDAPSMLHELPIFDGLDRSIITALSSLARDLCVPEGNPVFAVGDRGDELFFVRRGRVHVYLPLPGGKRHHLATFGRGEFFGEMAFLDHAVRSADAVAAKTTELYVMSRADFDVLSTQDARLATIVFERLAAGVAQRLRVANTELQFLEDR